MTVGTQEGLGLAEATRRVTLRDYQSENLDAVQALHAEGHRRLLGVAATGLGKTIMFGSLAERMKARTLILAHRDELVNQARDKVLTCWPDATVGIVKAERDEYRAPVVCASVQTVAGAARLRKLASREFDLVIVDECFPAGTLVGDVPIETLRPGDMVPSWEEQTGEPVQRPVVTTMRRTPEALLSVVFDDGERVTCTPNHPVMTDQGWCPAGALWDGASTLWLTHHADADRDDLYRVLHPCDADGEGEDRRVASVGACLLHGGVQGPLGEPEQFGADGADEQGARVGADEGTQPDGTARVSGEDEGDSGGSWSQASGAGRERDTAERSASGPSRVARVAHGGDRADGATAPAGYADALQARRGEPGGSGGGGGGRGVPCLAGPPRVRSAEGRVPAWRRVVRVEVHQPGSDGRYGGLCPDGAVYNIEVAGTHTYLVGSGLVAHNCHHAVANTYRRGLEAVGCGPDEVPWFGDDLGWSRPLLLGVTATPDRGDKVALRAVFDRIAFSQDMRWGIEAGYLTDLRPYRVVLDFDMADLRVTAGDYNDSDAADALVKAGAPMAAVDAWKLHADGRKALVFTPTVDSARLFARAFQQEGIAAGFVSGETPIEERRQLLDDFATGKLMVLSNCAVLTEGYDEPSVGCVIMAKPTKSRALYTQMLGRGVRLYPGKSDCVAIDLVGITGEHDLVTVPDLFGLPLSALRDNRSVSEAFAAAVEEEQRRLARAGAIRSEVVDVWAQRRARANFAWVEAMGGRCWVLNVGGGFVALEPEGGDNWRAVVKQAGSGFQRIIGGVPLGMAQGAAEDYVRRTAFGLVKKDARWRGAAPSAKQADAVRKWHGDPSGMTAGEASDFLAAKIATKELRSGPR